MFMLPLDYLGPLVGKLSTVTPEQARGGELSELVAHHVFRDVHGNKLVAVVHRYRMPDEVR